MSFRFEEKTHTYYLDDKPLMGVTSVLGSWGKGNLVAWSANQAADYVLQEVAKTTYTSVSQIIDDLQKRILGEARTAYARHRDAAGAKGTDIHGKLEKLINIAIKNGGYLPELKPRTKQIKSFYDWAKEANVKFLTSEQKMYSRKLWLAGTADFTCEIDGKHLVGDLKTGKSIQTTAFYQCAAYVLMLEEQGQKFDGTVIVHVPEKKALRVFKRYDLKTDTEAFKGILAAYKADKTFGELWKQ